MFENFLHKIRQVICTKIYARGLSEASFSLRLFGSIARPVQLKVISVVGQVCAGQHTEIIMGGFRYLVLEKAAGEDTARFFILVKLA